MTDTVVEASRGADPIPRMIWVGLVVVLLYVALVAGVPILLEPVLGDDPDPVVELAVTHLVPLPIAIAGALVFAWRAGWWHDVWTSRPLRASTPRRWWMLVVPIALAAQVVSLLAQAPWASLSIAYVLVGLLCYLLVGLGEELVVRGILLQSVRAHHGETVVLIVTSLVFGLAHAFSAAYHGMPIGGVAFTVAVTAMTAVQLYAALRVTGTLWVPIVLHGLGDYGRWVAGGDGHDHTTGVDIWVSVALTALSAAVVVSVIREDLRTRRDRRQASASPGASPGASTSLGSTP